MCEHCFENLDGGDVCVIRALEPDSCIVARVVCDLGAFGEKHGQASKKLRTKGGHYLLSRESNLSLLGGCLIG